MYQNSVEEPLKVDLRPVTKDNYEKVCDLEVLEQQRDYVACNMWSLVESMFNPHYQTRAIYRGSEPVGFLMWVADEPEKVSIWRFMVDKNYQQQGIGRRALQQAIDEIKQTKALQKIEICYDPANPVAKGFYASFGFTEVGMDAGGEDMLAVMQIKGRLHE
ncbi:GNAT family N-acetyltransferase [Exilibacterium tricleocarpae]|uniref:GNAT family N-acetyltransferase n=1 Tax=Exilibacterium tricleocarpae TaxID=2591008 RepID=A0A545STB4_9GAMM|nr:GNAT family N-acetyltransferase [Exilibacterium tricleocarpae]TQV68189.1 GNAT family N-acetyltransferase [Exilibacterium tricleocarpae]